MKSEKYHKYIGQLALMFSIAAPQLAFAASGHGDDHHAAGIGSLTYFFINFSIYSLILFVIAKKNMPALWASRRNALSKAIGSSKQKSAEIEGKLTEARMKMSTLQEELQLIDNRIAEEAKNEVGDISAATAKAIERLNQQAADRIAAEQKNLDSFMRGVYAAAALKIAEEKLKQRVNQESDRSFRAATADSLKDLLQ